MTAQYAEGGLTLLRLGMTSPQGSAARHCQCPQRYMWRVARSCNMLKQARVTGDSFDDNGDGGCYGESNSGGGCGGDTTKIELHLLLQLVIMMILTMILTTTMTVVTA